jgi:hypothetical protein
MNMSGQTNKEAAVVGSHSPMIACGGPAASHPFRFQDRDAGVAPLGFGRSGTSPVLPPIEPQAHSQQLARCPSRSRTSFGTHTSLLTV